MTALLGRLIALIVVAGLLFAAVASAGYLAFGQTGMLVATCTLDGVLLILGIARAV